MTTRRGRCDRPCTPTDPMQHDTITVSRLRHEAFFFFAITGWMAAFFLLGVLIGTAS